jgi:hypothetical protein
MLMLSIAHEHDIKLDPANCFHFSPAIVHTHVVSISILSIAFISHKGHFSTGVLQPPT